MCDLTQLRIVQCLACNCRNPFVPWPPWPPSGHNAMRSPVAGRPCPTAASGFPARRHSCPGYGSNVMPGPAPIQAHLVGIRFVCCCWLAGCAIVPSARFGRCARTHKRPQQHANSAAAFFCSQEFDHTLRCVCYGLGWMGGTNTRTHSTASPS